MPIYEYECSKCGVVEVMQGITEDPLKRCPNCRCKVKRLISLNNFHLKGTGWYATDYAKKSDGGNGTSHEKDKDEAPKSATNSSESSKSSKSSDKSSESSKPAASGSDK